ncbi:MAG: penicillin-binding protein 2 [bacterium]
MPGKAIQKNVKWLDTNSVKGQYLGNERPEEKSDWISLYLYLLSVFALGLISVSVINLQLVHGREYQSRSERNRLEEHVVQPDRGIIYDRNGTKVTSNTPSFNVILNPLDIDEGKLDDVISTLSEITGESEDDLMSQYNEAIKIDSMTQKIIMAQDIERDNVLEIRSLSDDLPGVWIDYSSKRNYLFSDVYSHVIGYTGEADENALDNDADLDLGDIVGIEGVEAYYDDFLRGDKGKRIVEIDASQRVVAEYVNEGSAPVSGDSLSLTIDNESQQKWYQILKAGMKKYEAKGAVAILEDVNTGEIWSAVSLPSYDNNLFVGGISTSDYLKLSSDAGLPLFNRIIAAQEPPGSMFKPIVASAALQEKAITKDTVFVSSGVIYLGIGTDYPFQEYHQKVYGPLDFIGGLAKSSNIYFCKTMLELGIENFVPYAEFFGIGSKTGIDLYGEMEGRLPSPENKIALAAVSPWLEPIWYDEGDSCNSAIGQGITSVTPLQVVNWVATIANGGKVMWPHLAYKWENDDTGKSREVESKVERSGMVDDSNLELVREGMRASTYGPQSVIVPLRDAKIPIAGKTGTAEFGVQDKEGYYTSTHAWVSGFFPYDDPQFSFVVFLEGGGESNNAAQLAREFIDWFVDSGKLNE